MAAVGNNGASGSSPFNAPLSRLRHPLHDVVRVLRFVTRHRSAGRFEVCRGERNAGAEILRQRDQEGRLSACRIHRAKSLDGKRHVEQTLRHAGCAGPNELRHDAAHEPMVRMARCSVRSPRDHGVGTEPLQFFLHPRGQLKETRAILHVAAELCVWKPEQNRWMDPERVRRAASLFATHAGEFWATRDRRMRPTLGAVRRDDQVDLHALAGVARENRRRGALVVGVGEHRDQRLGCALGQHLWKHHRFEKRHCHGDQLIQQRRDRECSDHHRAARDRLEHHVFRFSVIHDRLLNATITRLEAIRA